MADFWKTASISFAATGDQTVVAAVTGKRICVVSYGLSSVDAKTITWKSGAATSISGPMHFAANSQVHARAVGQHGIAGPQSPLFRTAVGQALILIASAGTQYSGFVTYWLEEPET